MFVKCIKTRKGIQRVGEHRVDKIDLHDDGTATIYTFGGNVFTVKVKKVLDDSRPGTDFKKCPYKQKR